MLLPRFVGVLLLSLAFRDGIPYLADRLLGGFAIDSFLWREISAFGFSAILVFLVFLRPMRRVMWGDRKGRVRPKDPSEFEEPELADLWLWSIDDTQSRYRFITAVLMWFGIAGTVLFSDDPLYRALHGLQTTPSVAASTIGHGNAFVAVDRFAIDRAAYRDQSALYPHEYVRVQPFVTSKGPGQGHQAIWYGLHHRGKSSTKRGRLEARPNAYDFFETHHPAETRYFERVRKSRTLSLFQHAIAGSERLESQTELLVYQAMTGSFDHHMAEELDNLVLFVLGATAVVLFLPLFGRVDDDRLVAHAHRVSHTNDKRVIRKLMLPSRSRFTTPALVIICSATYYLVAACAYTTPLSSAYERGILSVLFEAPTISMLSAWGALDPGWVPLETPWRLATYALLHENLIQLSFSLLLLMWLGTQLERRLTSVSVFLVAMFSAIGTGLLSVALNSDPIVGATGIGFGFGGALIALLPRGMITNRVLLVVPLLLFVQVFFLPTVSSPHFFANVAGLVTGLIMGMILPAR